MRRPCETTSGHPTLTVFGLCPDCGRDHYLIFVLSKIRDWNQKTKRETVIVCHYATTVEVTSCEY
jgi:hypothetical protein